MMFPTFTERYRRDAGLSVGNEASTQGAVAPALVALVSQWGGASFDRGLYRIMRAADVNGWHDRVARAFPLYTNRIGCFAFDWLGRVFAIDSARQEDGRPGVLMFEPGTGQVLEIPSNLETFHESELIEYQDAALASDFYDRWLAAGGAAPTVTQCIGYKVPLFLGGVDDLSNLEVSDVDVYWELMGQLISKARSLPVGARMNLS